MTISSISGSQVYPTPQVSQTSSTSQDSSTPQVSGGHHHRHSGGSDFMKAIEQALSQMGLSLNSQTPSSSQTAGVTDSDGDGSSSATQNSRQALHAFMHDLFSALKTIQNQTTGAGSNGDTSGSSQVTSAQSGYSSNLSNKLQDVIQALGSSSPSDQSGGLSNLESDFQNLVSSLGSENSKSGTQSTDLQTFLQNLVQNLSGQQASSPAVGAFVNAAA